MRAINLVLGLFFLALGIVGIFLPVIPTTGPLLLALWFFARSSRRLHDWMVNHRVLGKYVHELWVRGGLTRRSKNRALVAMSAVIVLSSIIVGFTAHGTSLWVIEGGLAVGWAIATAFIATRRTLEPAVTSVPPEVPGENP